MSNNFFHFISLLFQLDLPFSIPFYRWLLNEELSVGLSDLSRVAPEVQQTLVRLQDVVHQREMILADSGLDAMEKTEKVILSFIQFSYHLDY